MSRFFVPAVLSCAVVLQAAAQGVVPAAPPAAAVGTVPVRIAPAPVAASGPAPSPRVQREAANPTRIILEASKIRRRPAEGAPQAVAGASAGPAAARRTSVRAVASVPTALPTAQPLGIVETVTPLPPVATSGTGSSPAPAPSAALAPVPMPLPGPLPSTPSLPKVATTPPQAASAAAPAAVVAAPAVPAALIASPPALPAAVPAAEPLAPGARPRIVSMVAPEFPAGVLRRVGSFNEITVQITINRDGTVGQVSVPSPAYRALEPYVVDALQRWRFEAPGEPRSQRLQLVFNN